MLLRIGYVRRALTVFSALVLTPACTPSPSPSLIKLSGPTMGTQYLVQLPSLPPGENPERLRAEVEHELAAVNAAMSTYIDDSEISRFGSHRENDWFGVSPTTAKVVREALRIGELTGGAFDITVAPIVDRWGFGSDRRRDGIPSPQEISALLTHTGFNKVAVRETPPALRKKTAKLRVDLSGIAKGYAVDAIAELLESKGIHDYWVDIGGDLRVAGRRGKRAWRSGIEKPTEGGGRAVLKIIELSDRAMATSGDYRNFFVRDGRRFSHTIDPRTGSPVTHKLASVSVIAPTCMEADALATAFLVLGPDDGYNLASKLGVPAYFIVRTTDEVRTSDFRTLTTPALHALLQAQ